MQETLNQILSIVKTILKEIRDIKTELKDTVNFLEC